MFLGTQLVSHKGGNEAREAVLQVRTANHRGVLLPMCVSRRIPRKRFPSVNRMQHWLTSQEGSGRTGDTMWPFAWLTGVMCEQQGQSNTLQNADKMASGKPIAVPLFHSNLVALSPGFYPALNTQPQQEYPL